MAFEFLKGTLMNIASILKIAKPLTTIVASAATGIVVKNVIKATTPADLTKYQKFMVGAGGFFVAGFAGDLVSDNLEKQFDKVIAIFEPKALEATVVDERSDQEKLNDIFAALTPEEQDIVGRAIMGEVISVSEGKDQNTEKGDDTDGH